MDWKDHIYAVAYMMGFAILCVASFLGLPILLAMVLAGVFG